MKQKPKTCVHCGEEFTPERRNGIYCSQTCRQYSYLSRKTGETYGLPKKEIVNDTLEEIPALVIDEDEMKESNNVNEPVKVTPSPPVIYTFKDQKTSTQNNNWQYPAAVNKVNKPIIKQTPIMKIEEQTTKQNIAPEEIPVMLIDKKSTAFLDETTIVEPDEFLPRKTYADILDDKKQDANFDLNAWWDLSRPGKAERTKAYQYGQRIKPFIKSLLMMDGRKVPLKSLQELRREEQRIFSSYYPDNTCPIFYPPIGFFANDYLQNVEEFVKSIEFLGIKTVIVKLSDTLKAEAETAIKVVDSYPSDAPAFWTLP